MTVKGYRCTNCDITLVSRTPSDIVICECGRTRITGGLDHPEINVDGVTLVLPTLLNIQLPDKFTADTFHWDRELLDDALCVFKPEQLLIFDDRVLLKPSHLSFEL